MKAKTQHWRKIPCLAPRNGCHGDGWKRTVAIFYAIDLIHKSHNAPLPDPTMHYFVTKICTCVHVSVTKWWDLWYGFIGLEQTGCHCSNDIWNDFLLVKMVIFRLNLTRSFFIGQRIMGLLPDTRNCGCAYAGDAGNVFPITAGERSRHASRHVRHARAVIANYRFPLKSAAGGNVPGIPGACATCNFTYLVRDPLRGYYDTLERFTIYSLCVLTCTTYAARRSKVIMIINKMS